MEKSLLNQAVHQEITRRAAQGGEPGHHWAEYLLLTTACRQILERMPDSPEDCNQVGIEDLLEEGLNKLADAIYQILPGGIREFRSYLSKAP